MSADVAYQQQQEMDFDYALARSSPKGQPMDRRRPEEQYYDDDNSDHPRVSQQESDEQLFGFAQQRANENGPPVSISKSRQPSYQGQDPNSPDFKAQYKNLSPTSKRAPFGTDNLVSSPANRRQLQPGYNKPVDSCPFGTDANYLRSQHIFPGGHKNRMEAEANTDHLTSSFLVDESKNAQRDYATHFHYPKQKPSEMHPAQINFAKNQSLGIFPPKEERSKEKPRGVVIDVDKHTREEKWGVIGVGADPDLPAYRPGKASYGVNKMESHVFETAEPVIEAPPVYQHRRAKAASDEPWSKQHPEPPFARPEISPYNDKSREPKLGGVMIKGSTFQSAPYGLDTGFGMPFDRVATPMNLMGPVPNYRGKQMDISLNPNRSMQYPYGRVGDGPDAVKTQKHYDDAKLLERAKSKTPWGIPGELPSDHYDPFKNSHKRREANEGVPDPLHNCITDPWNQ